MIRYSEEFKGDLINHRWPVSFDDQSGCIGINQEKDDGKVLERVLLSPQQVKALIAFVKAKPARKPRARTR